jgi:hypothetical protein
MIIQALTPTFNDSTLSFWGILTEGYRSNNGLSSPFPSFPNKIKQGLSI